MKETGDPVPSAMAIVLAVRKVTGLSAVNGRKAATLAVVSAVFLVAKGVPAAC